nr:hypothetical protein [Tanacetum cinerariifolium]
MRATDEGVRPDFQILLKMDECNDTADSISVDPPEDYISDIPSLTLPRDASRAAAISKTFNTTSDSDFEVFLDLDFWRSYGGESCSIRSSLLARETLPDVKEAFAIIPREESHIGITSSSSSTVTKPQVGHTVDRCFDIIGYPPRYNKNHGPKPNGPRTFNANFVSSSSEK